MQDAIYGYALLMGRKLVALILVMGVLAVTIAVVIPNLIESRVTSCESAAAASLKSALLPAEVQFQNGGYCDRDHDGIGTYAVVGITDRDGAPRDPYEVLSGRASIGGATLSYLAPRFAEVEHTIGRYVYREPLSVVTPTAINESPAERFWATICYPMDATSGRRFFAINQSGNVYSLPEPASASGARVVCDHGETVRALAERTTMQDIFGAEFDEVPAGYWDKRPVPRTKQPKSRPIDLYPRR